MNKKAVEFAISPVAALILVLIVAGVLLLLVSNIGAFQKEQSEIETCRLSFLALHQLGLTKDAVDLTLDCPRVKIPLDDEYIEDGSLDDGKVFDLLAEELYTCYSKTGKGQLNPEKSTVSENVCVICSEISATPEVIALQESFDGFDDYLFVRRIPGQQEYFSDLFNISGTSSINYAITQESNTFFVVWRASKSALSRFSFGALGEYTIGYDFVPASTIYERDIGGDRYCDKLLN